MHAQVLTAVFVLLATATDGARDALFPRWLTRGQLPAPHSRSTDDDVLSINSSPFPSSTIRPDGARDALFPRWLTRGQLPAPHSRSTDDDVLSINSSPFPSSTIRPDGARDALFPRWLTRGQLPAPHSRSTDDDVLSINSSPFPSSTIRPDGAHDALFPRWVTRGQLPAPRPPAAGALRQHEAPPATAEDTAWSKMADTDNSVMYFVETKQELFVFGKGSNAPSASSSAPATSTSAPATNTSPPATNTGAADSSSIAPTTGIDVLTTGTDNDMLIINSSPFPSSPIRPGYTYYPATGSYYKYHHKDLVSWDVANSTCASEGAHLVVINDAEEAELVTRLVQDATDSYYLTWTGLQYIQVEGVMEWRTVNGEPFSAVFHEWHGNRPRDNARMACAFFNTAIKLLNDANCRYNYYFVCEISQ